jgi:hypothetical protein
MRKPIYTELASLKEASVEGLSLPASCGQFFAHLNLCRVVFQARLFGSLAVPAATIAAAESNANIDCRRSIVAVCRSRPIAIRGRCDDATT